MQREAVAAETTGEPAEPAAAAALPPQACILPLQRTAGNRAVAQMLARAERTKPGFGDAPAVELGEQERNAWVAEEKSIL